ncbi:MAG: molecular chaperone HtpG, partial [Flavisolibacter sp.]
DKLSELFKKDRKAYEAKWSDIGLFVKYGMISEEKFYEKAKDFALLTNTKSEFFTLEEYNIKVRDFQTDTSGSVVYLYTIDPERQDSYIQAAHKKGYDVLVMNSPIDNHFISQLEHKLDKVALKRVDSDVIDKLIPKSDAGSHSLTPEESNKLKEIFDKAINNPSMKVEIESLDKDELPVTVTMDEWMRRMKDMARLGGGGMNFYGSMPDSYKVSINGNHKLVDRILKTENPDEQSILAKQAFDLALLSQGMLKGAELTAFVTRSVNLI